MPANAPLLPSQRVAQACLLIFGTIALFGGPLQMYLGQPETAPRLDNVHRFLAGVYLGTGMISLWAGATIRRQSTLVFLLALAVFLAGIGRLVSMSKVGDGEGISSAPPNIGWSWPSCIAEMRWAVMA